MGELGPFQVTAGEILTCVTLMERSNVIFPLMGVENYLIFGVTEVDKLDFAPGGGLWGVWGRQCCYHTH